MTAITAIPDLVTAPDANNNELDINHVSAPQIFKKVVLAIEVISGSFKFNVGATAVSSNTTYSVGEKTIISLEGNHKLNFKATTTGDTFRVSI